MLLSLQTHSCEQQAGEEPKGKAPTAVAGTSPRGEAVLEVTGAMSWVIPPLLGEGACEPRRRGRP